ALDRPERVAKLALVEAPLPPSQFDAIATQRPQELAPALSPPLREAIARGRRQSVRLYESLRFLLESTSLAADVRAEPDVPDAALAPIACPVLCAYGEASSCLPVGRRLARAIPVARLVEVPGGHFVHLD